jgi:creatinine amidohydrolase
VAEKTDVIVTPTIPFGISLHHIDFPGTITLTPETLTGLLTDISSCLIRHGARTILVINAHGGNTPVITEALRYFQDKIREKTQVKIFIVQVLRIASALSDTVKAWGGGHADRREASAILAIHPNLVKAEHLGPPKRDTLSDRIKIENFDTVRFGPATLTMLLYTKQLSDIGPFGETAGGSAEVGEEIFEKTASYIAELVEELKTLT